MDWTWIVEVSPDDARRDMMAKGFIHDPALENFCAERL
jgi:hypothetical protein